MYYNDYLQHHGILGQKWGVRRYQNPDGTWTAEGKRRRSDLSTSKESARDQRTAKKINARYDLSNDAHLGRTFETKFAMRARRNANRVNARAEVKAEKYGEYSKKSTKARTKAQKVEAQARKYEALVNKLRDLEFSNLEQGVYYSNRRANIGKKVARSVALSAVGGAMLATTGVGFVAIPTGRTTSLTKEQYGQAKQFADSVYWNNMPMPSNAITDGSDSWRNR